MSRMSGATLLAAAALSVASPVSAQPAQNPSQGPMTIERLHSGFLAGGDVKVSDVDRQTGVFVGGQGGWLVDDALFMGGGAWFLTNGDNGRDMGYGGFIVRYTVHGTEPIGFGVGALLGGGWAELPYSYAVPTYPANLPRNLQTALNNTQRNQPTFRPTTVWYSDGFFVAEPEAHVSLKLSRKVRVLGGVSYRFTSSYYNSGIDDRLNGVTSTISVQFF